MEIIGVRKIDNKCFIIIKNKFSLKIDTKSISSNLYNYLVENSVEIKHVDCIKSKLKKL